jgi:polyhydroxyalkanoate synthesis regulator phasin
MTPENAAPPATPPAPRRGPGHRGQDLRDAVAEMTAKAHEISLEAGSKMSAAMREVIHAAAGISQFAAESARDLVQFMVRRGQMTQDEADKLIKEAEEFASKNKRPIKAAAAPKAEAAKKPPAAPKPAAAPKAKAAPKPAAAKVAKKK